MLLMGFIQIKIEFRKSGVADLENTWVNDFYFENRFVCRIYVIILN